LKSLLEQLLLAAVRKLVGTLVPEMPDEATVTVERTRDAAHGDYVSNLAMRLAKAASRDPRELALAIVHALPANAAVAKAEVAGAGFINFFLRPNAFAPGIRRIHELADAYGRSSSGAGKRVDLAAIIVDKPDELLDVTRGRQAVYSDALAEVLRAAGYDVHRDPSLGAPPVQRVTLYRGSEPIQNTMRELRDEVGADACRFFFLMRSHQQQLDLDVTLAKARTNENPVYYVQYVYARATSAMKEVKARALSFDVAAGLDKLDLLDKDTELALIATLLRFPDEVDGAAANCAPHTIVYYLREVANAFHNYYNAEKWIVTETDLRNARLALVLAARQVVRNGLALLGISAPESM
jgi:arginyl-tRNA synthetase